MYYTKYSNTKKRKISLGKYIFSIHIYFVNFTKAIIETSNAYSMSPSEINDNLVCTLYMSMLIIHLIV